MRSKGIKSFLGLCVMFMLLSPATALSQGPVDLFPVPVSDDTTLFPYVDDSYLEVLFTQGFTFDFYGSTYNSIFLNTNEIRCSVTLKYKFKHEELL